MRIVILKGFFDEEKERNEEELINLETDIKSEVSKIGHVIKLELFKDNPKGIMKIKFDKSSDAEWCIKLMNDWIYDGNKIQAFHWDGVTDYKWVWESDD